MRILQEVAIRVRKDEFSLSKTSMDNISSIPHDIKLPFSYLIIGLIIDEDKISLAKGARVDMGVKMGLQPSLGYFDHLERSMIVLIGLFKCK